MGPIGVPFLPGWSYRKSHVIEGTTGGAQDYYQMRTTVHYGAGTDSGIDVYLDEKCRADFGDIRVTKDDGVTELAYVLTSLFSGVSTELWPRVLNIPASPGSVTIYIYYGKADATTTSSEEDTWDLTENFDTDTSASYNITAWKGLNGVTHVMTWNAGGYMNISYGGSIGPCMITQDGTSFGSGYGIMCQVRLGNTGVNNQAGPGIRGAATDDLSAMGGSLRSLPTYDGIIRLFRGSGGSNYNLAYDWLWGFPSGTWKTITLGMTDDVVIMHITHVEELRADFEMEDGEAGLEVHMPAGGSVLWAAMIIRRFTDPEPAHGDWGEEEEA